MTDLYQDDEESWAASAHIGLSPYLEPASVLEPIPTPVAEPCVPPIIPASWQGTQEDSDEEDIWAKARGSGSAEKAGHRVPKVPTTEQLMAKAVGKVAAAAVSAALATGVHCTRATGHAAAVPAAAAPSQQSSMHQGVLQAPLPAAGPQQIQRSLRSSKLLGRRTLRTRGL